MSDTKSLGAINAFKNRYNIVVGKCFIVSVNVYDECDKCICTDTCECSINRNYEYQQTQLDILWKYNQAQLNKLCLRSSYNTNFHKFLLVDDSLHIHDTNRKIEIQINKED